jgi:PTS system nitrogen regulatory IIA component
MGGMASGTACDETCRPSTSHELFMQLTDLLTADRVAIQSQNPTGKFDKEGALAALATMLASGDRRIAKNDVERILIEREQLQSTGIGEGVAIPHGALAQLDTQLASLLVVPAGVDFAAIDGLKVTILFAVIGPKRATGEHLKTLARVSRLLRNKGFRERLVAAPNAGAAYELLAAEEAEHR